MGKRRDFLPSLRNGMRTEARAERVQEIQEKINRGYFALDTTEDRVAEALFEVFCERVMGEV